jgi:HD-GYP domain-containing protein (c-di-GMP phosphodiesterase class II)
VADTFDAMTTRRPYRESRPPEQAMAELRRVAGTQLDPEAVEAFVAAHPHPERLPLSA